MNIKENEILKANVLLFFDVLHLKNNKTKN